MNPCSRGYYGRASDCLGIETDEMLRDRITRSLNTDERVPYEPRQGPVQKSPTEIKWYLFECELNALLEKHELELEVDYDGAYVTIDGEEFYL